MAHQRHAPNCASQNTELFLHCLRYIAFGERHDVTTQMFSVNSVPRWGVGSPGTQVMY